MSVSQISCRWSICSRVITSTRSGVFAASAGSAAAVTITFDDIFSSDEPHIPRRAFRPAASVKCLLHRCERAISHAHAVAPRRQIDRKFPSVPLWALMAAALRIDGLRKNGCAAIRGAAWVGYGSGDCGCVKLMWRCELCGCCLNRQFQRKNSGGYGQKRMQSHFFPPLPLARELKVVRKRTRCVRIRIETPPVSWLGELPQYFRAGSAAFPSMPRINMRFAAWSVACAENFFALQSRGGDGFSPSSRARSLG